MACRWVAAAGLALIFLVPVNANAYCIDLSGHYVLVSEASTSLIRVTQKSCESIDYAVLAIRGNQVKPLGSINYRNGTGFKPLPGDQDTEYELVLKENTGIIRMKKTGEHGSLCMDSIEFERDAYQNLVGTYSYFCNDGSAQIRTVIFYKL